MFETVRHNRLQEFISQCLQAAGLPMPDAHAVAGLMARADLIGADAHGVFRLPQYIKRIRSGGINVRPNISVERERAATALLNGDNAMGHLVMKRAAEIAVEKAGTTGVAWVGAHHSNHAGPASLYAEIPLRHDMIGLYVAVGSANHLPPWGGTDMLLSTNPIAVAIPAANRPPVVLDMATTVAAYGKVKAKAKAGEMMPEGWMIDRLGRPLTDPKKSNEGFLLPIGGPKGYGLALVFGLLAGTLNGAAFGRDVVDFNADSKTVTNTGHFVIALNVEAFTDLSTFKEGVDEIWDQMKASEKLPGTDEIRLPGEGLHQRAEARTVEGIPIPAALREDLDVLAKSLVVPTL